MKWSRNTTLDPPPSPSSPPLCHSPPHHHYHRWRYLYRLHLNLECREFSLPFFIPLFSAFLATDRRVLLARKAAKNSPVIESILCKPISDPHLPVTMLSSQLVVPPSPFPPPPPRFTIHGAWYARRRKVLSTPPLPPSYSLFFPRYRSVCKYWTTSAWARTKVGKARRDDVGKGDGTGKGAIAVVAAV